MKKQIVMFFAAVMAVISAQAATWTDPDTGYTWTYTVSGDTAQIYKGNNAAAISPSPTGELTIPSQLNGKTVTNIGNYAFVGCSGLTGVTIPDGVTSIGQYAFQNCTGLTGTLTIPGSVTSIGSYAFQNCSGFTGSLTIEQGVTSIGNYAFQNCSGFTDVSIPSTVEYLYRAFDKNIGIKSVTIADGAKIIGGFSGCTGLTEIEIPNSVTKIDAYAFADCTELVNVNMPTDIKVIGEYAFSGCQKLLKIEWLPGVTVGQYAFQNCSSWQGIFTVPEGVTEIAAGTFKGCSGLQQIILPDGITTIGYEAFSYCWSLTEMRLPQGLTKISDAMFWECYHLANVTIPDSVTSIGYGAFRNCSLIGGLKIPYGVTSLGSEVFYNSRLKSITIPATLVNIAENAFWSPYTRPFPETIIFECDLPLGFELWSSVVFNGNVSFPRTSGGRAFAKWPIGNFMGYTQTNAPTVTIISSKIRENDPEVLDVVFKVNSTKPTVKVRALAFEDGVRSFANVVRAESFIADSEGNETSGNVGDAVAANVEHTLSWKVSSDWATRLAKVSFEVLATEDEILPMELMTIPGTPAHPETWQVLWNCITADKLFEAFLWLYADRDLGLTLQDGVLKTGDTILCEGASIYIYGGKDAWEYIYRKLGFTRLDGEALDYVREVTRLDLNNLSAYRVVGAAAGE